MVRWALVAIVLFAIGAAIVTARSTPSHPTPAPLAVRSSGSSFATLQDLVRASDLVVDGVVTGVADGRVFSDRGSSGVRSQIVTLRIRRTLVGRPPGSRIAIEEEAATADGRAIVVDGLRPTREGDAGVFFLTGGPGDDEPYFVTVSTLGRYLRRPPPSGSDVLVGATDAGPLAGRVAALGRRRLDAAVRATAPAR